MGSKSEPHRSIPLPTLKGFQDRRKMRSRPRAGPTPPSSTRPFAPRRANSRGADGLSCCPASPRDCPLDCPCSCKANFTRSSQMSPSAGWSRHWATSRLPGRGLGPEQLFTENTLVADPSAASSPRDGSVIRPSHEALGHSCSSRISLADMGGRLRPRPLQQFQTAGLELLC